ncbi:MAG TPA: hypothetical protein VLA81_09985 [Burkholderiales bacterium]|nr:hypothetical protein [Burkholderiales bacterium]
MHRRGAEAAQQLARLGGIGNQRVAVNVRVGFFDQPFTVSQMPLLRCPATRSTPPRPPTSCTQKRVNCAFGLT